jgi:hypothetical protein
VFDQQKLVILESNRVINVLINAAFLAKIMMMMMMINNDDDDDDK